MKIAVIAVYLVIRMSGLVVMPAALDANFSLALAIPTCGGVCTVRS